MEIKRGKGGKVPAAWSYLIVGDKLYVYKGGWRPVTGGRVNDYGPVLDRVAMAAVNARFNDKHGWPGHPQQKDVIQ